MIKYVSTRGDSEPKSFENVLLAGMAPDGGLYVPDSFPVLDERSLHNLAGCSYVDVAAQIMQPYIGDCIPAEDFKNILEDVYAGSTFNHAAVAPLTQISPQIWLMELHRGPTLAFKDVALQLLGRLFDYVLERKGERVTIVGATSGDTGSAAIEACKNCRNVDIFILHPRGRVSEVQRRQMTTVQADNVFNLAVEGSFDDCQKIVKDMFADTEFRDSLRLSAVNSINWARLMAQIVYYVTAALALGAPARPVSFAVPTGNFGNVFAAFAARKMGLPVRSLIISTNRNDILTRFFETGIMKRENVEPSLSPSMDIQVSSNFERYLYLLLGRNADDLKTHMNAFSQTGEMQLSEEVIARARRDFKAHRSDDETTLAMIKACYEETGELIDPHTAVGLAAALSAKEDPDVPLVNLACAHAAKFPEAVEKATSIRPSLPPRLSALMTEPEFVTPVDNDLQSVQSYIKEHAHIMQDQT